MTAEILQGTPTFKPKSERVIAERALAQRCPKCNAPGLSKTEYRYPVLGFSELELECISCGLSLWPRTEESPAQSYFRWLMDRAGFARSGFTIQFPDSG